MKNKILQLLIISGLFVASACNDLNLNPLSEGSSESWYSNESEIRMSVNDLYRITFWPVDIDEWTDDYTRRDLTTPVTNATINGEWSTAVSVWQNAYKSIARANSVIENLERSAGTIPQSSLDKYEAEARFVRAAQYAYLISHYGDVIYFTGVLDLEEAFTMSRTDKNTILQAIYEDFDFAASKLPNSYGSSQNQRATKGAALAMKARIAMFYGNWAIARDAAKACIDLGVYDLASDFGTLFLPATKNPKELIFGLPRSVVFNVKTGNKNFVSRNSGGWGAAEAPSWDLFCSFLCADGLPIDESPLFDPRKPFKNRDPRCSATIVEFGTPWLGFIYEPHPDTLNVLNLNTGKYQKNNDTRSNAQFASFNGLMWKKGIDLTWTVDNNSENELIIMRYADLLLMYTEAKIELGEIDQAMLDATINKVRARAYKVQVADKTKYPVVVAGSKEAMRKAVRIERRMELAFEGRRYMDIIRWKLAEKVLNYDIYGMLDVADLRTKVVKPGLWFFPMTPDIDEDGVAILEPMYSAGLCRRLALRDFDKNRQYLWPIPTKEILINSNLKQNDGY
jgi:hypothetical protein